MENTSTAPEADTSKVLPFSSVRVEIFDQTYLLRGTDQPYLQQLAAGVDAKMRAVSAQGNTIDSLRVAVLAALNIADELATLRERYDALSGRLTQSQSSVRTRAGSLSHLLDEVLEERKVG